MWGRAYDEDFMADSQAAIVLLFGDDLLQRFAALVFGCPISAGAGFGREYPISWNFAELTIFYTRGLDGAIPLCYCTSVLVRQSVDTVHQKGPQS